MRIRGADAEQVSGWWRLSPVRGLPVLAWHGVRKREPWREAGSPSCPQNNPLLEKVQRNASNLLISSISNKANTQCITQGDRPGQTWLLHEHGAGGRWVRGTSLPIP